MAAATRRRGCVRSSAKVSATTAAEMASATAKMPATATALSERRSCEPERQQCYE
jgi:hypothetical protein